MKIIRRDYGQGSGKQETKLKTDELLIDRLAYRRLGSLTDNKMLTTPISASGDFERFLLDMNALHNHKYYPSLVTKQPTPDLIALDEYLGTLGITEIYPFSEDTYKVEPWAVIGVQSTYRILVDESDNTYLVDGDEVLVAYT